MTELEKATNAEITEWSKLVDKFAGELQKYTMICYYCGTFMKQESINTECPKNIYSTSQQPEDCTIPLYLAISLW